ncbi:uncharacterized protein CPUR_02725 [Claviceps purpurea 20.1]|uniref:IgE-binding protein n=1 Tax=Claviceps purpurea (strain 20.1) TaxID=1111077 RepID=M1WCT3_CLAP2|nr:uncharacterized protein CPUR_02725 [Claviceps purpurea 20.1]
MKSSLSFTFTTLLPLLAAAQPIASSAVSLAVNLPGSPLNNQPVVANGGKFWIGKPTSQYCPDNVEKLGGCPKGKDTSIWVNSEQGTGSLNVIVPGGQQIYVGVDTSLSFTRPHSAYIPPGSTSVQFSLIPLNQLAMVGRRILACLPPSTETNESTSSWQVFAPRTDEAAPPNRQCVAFVAQTAAAKDAVWEYI